MTKNQQCITLGHAADARPLLPEATPEAKPTREEEKARQTPLLRIDAISRDLVGVTNWQEVVKDRAKWGVVVRQPKPVTV